MAYVESVARGDGIASADKRGSRALDYSSRAVERGEISFNPEYDGHWPTSDVRSRRTMLDRISRSDRSSPGNELSTASLYPPLYYMMQAQALRASADVSYLEAVHNLRLLNVLLAALTLVVQFLTFRLVFADGWRPWVCVGLACFIPQYSFMSAAINPDTLVTLAVSTALLFACIAWQRPWNMWLWLLIGLAIGVGLLSKATAAIAFGAVGVLIAYAWRRLDRRHFALGAALAVATPPALASWWYLGSRGASSLNPSNHAHTVGLGLAQVQSYLSFLGTQWKLRLVTSFWGDFGWMDTPLHPTSQAVLYVFFGLAVAGGFLSLVNRRRTSPCLLIVSVPAVLIVTLLLAIDYYHYTGGTQIGFLQGRYLFPAMTGLISMFVWGLTEPFQSRWARRAAGMAVVLTMFLVQVDAALQSVLPRYYG